MNKELLKRIKLLPDVIASIFYLRFYKLLSPWFNIKPKRVQIALTYQCNSRCIMCNIWKMKEFSKISVKNWNKILNDPIFSEIKYIDITGGEALLHPDFTDLINIFVKKLPKLKKINLVSNGFLTSRSKKNLESLISYLDRKKIALGIAVSLDGYGKMHEEIRGIPQAFEKVSQTLSDLKKLQNQYQ